MKATIFITTPPSPMIKNLRVGQFVSYNDIKYKVKNTNGSHCDLESKDTGVYGVPNVDVESLDFKDIFPTVYNSMFKGMSSSVQMEDQRSAFLCEASGAIEANKEKYAKRNDITILHAKRILQDSMDSKVASYLAQHEGSTHDDAEKEILTSWKIENKIGVPDKEEDAKDSPEEEKEEGAE